MMDLSSKESICILNIEAFSAEFQNSKPMCKDDAYQNIGSGTAFTKFMHLPMIVVFP